MSARAMLRTRLRSTYARLIRAAPCHMSQSVRSILAAPDDVVGRPAPSSKTFDEEAHVANHVRPSQGRSSAQDLLPSPRSLCGDTATERVRVGVSQS